MAPMWDRIDPLAEKYYGISPYAYCGGDPVNFGDYDGRKVRDTGDFKGYNENDYMLLDDVYCVATTSTYNVQCRTTYVGGFDYISFACQNGAELQRFGWEEEYDRLKNTGSPKGKSRRYDPSKKRRPSAKGQQGKNGRHRAKQAIERFSKIRRLFWATGTVLSTADLYTRLDGAGPNLKRYLMYNYALTTGINTAGEFSKNPYVSAFALGYSIGPLIENIFDISIQINPYTMDFTPIEDTLIEFDEKGWDIYYPLYSPE